jgi:ribose 1,5-bisphosphate isomerase
MKKETFNQICKDIKSIKIQGARNVAKAGLKAYQLNPTKASKKKLLSLRPTEPMLQNVLDLAEEQPIERILNHFQVAQDKINKHTLKLIKSKDIIYTHCHSTNVSHSLIYAKKKGKSFQVYNTETRPLFQGRKTARELKNANIKVTMFIDSAMDIALSEKQKTKKVNKIFIGADALTRNGIVNKVGSGAIAKLAMINKIPLYIIADSWKYSKNKVPMETRKLNEIWDKAPKNIKIKNPSFEFVPKKYIKKIITEHGALSYNDFLEGVG